MLPCPACKKMTAPDKLGNWFQCQQCEHWLCLRADSKSNTTWLQPGIRVNEKIYEISITQAAAVPGSVPAANAERSYSTAVPAAPQTLESIQIERTEVRRNLATAEAELRRLAAQMSTNTSTAAIERINNEITKVKNTRESLLAREKDLLAQKSNLEAQKRERERLSAAPVSTSNKPPSRNQGMAFGCSTLLVAAALILFGIKVNIIWNVNALLWLTGITLVGGVIFLIGYNVD